jgi:hypothetical protein
MSVRAFLIVGSQLHQSKHQDALTHPQPQNPQAQTSQPLRATPKPSHARLRALRPTSRPSRATLATSQRQGSKHRVQRLQRWPQRSFSRGQPFNPCARRRRPSHSEAFNLALRSFSLARGAGSVAREGRWVAREVETVARGVQTVAGEGEERRGRRWRGGEWGVCRRVRACRGVFRNSPTGQWGWRRHGRARRASSLRGPAIGRRTREVCPHDPESGRSRFHRRCARCH